MTQEQNQNVDQLVAALADEDVMKRQRGREALVNIGTTAVPGLLAALADKQQHVRWEAAKTLAAIADPSAAEALVIALGDVDSDVRWVVGEALIALRGDAVKPLLGGLTKRQESEGFYESAHHILHDLSQHNDLGSVLAPVLKALDQLEPEVAVPVAAQEALENIG